MTADTTGNIYYEYFDEGLKGTDDPLTPVDEKYGRMSKSKRSAVDTDGCLSFSYAYSG